MSDVAQENNLRIRVELVNTGTTYRYVGYEPVRKIRLDNDYAHMLEHYEFGRLHQRWNFSGHSS